MKKNTKIFYLIIIFLTIGVLFIISCNISNTDKIDPDYVGRWSSGHSMITSYVYTFKIASFSHYSGPFYASEGKTGELSVYRNTMTMVCKQRYVDYINTIIYEDIDYIEKAQYSIYDNNNYMMLIIDSNNDGIYNEIPVFLERLPR